ncbi:ligand-binding protein SH3 [Sporomusaceae bacterium FL31]|nr:ligand-binding protein SH3 [Sporomusaceae bacterium FL31]GCE34108.1 ligand-binding protein SH3 [Sporomusaceae bacterium]
MDDELRASGSTTASNTTSSSGVTTVDSADVICGCPEPGPETIEVEQVLAAEMRQKVVEFDMFVPEQKPDIEQVVDVYVKDVCIKTVDIIPNKVIIRGDLEVKVMYVADLPDQPVHAFEKKRIRFTRDIDVDGAEQDMKATADVQVEYVDYDFHRRHDNRKVHITVVLKFWTRVLTTTEMDVYALSPIDEVGIFESTTASTSSDDSVSASSFNDETVSATQTGGGQIEAFSPDNMLITGPLTSTAGTNLSINGTMGAVSGNNVNVRTGPGTNFPSVKKVNQGESVTIKEQAFGWYRVVLSDGSTTGWIASWLVNTGSGTTTGAKG